MSCNCDSYIGGATKKSPFVCQKREAGKFKCTGVIGKYRKHKTFEQNWKNTRCGASDFKKCSQVLVSSAESPAAPPMQPYPPAAPQGPMHPPISPAKTIKACVNKLSSAKCYKKVSKGKCTKEKVGGRKGKCALACNAVCYEKTA